MARVRGALVRAAKNPLPLLLTGENGTGKDLAASVAHELSLRRNNPSSPSTAVPFPRVWRRPSSSGASEVRSPGQKTAWVSVSKRLEGLYFSMKSASWRRKSSQNFFGSLKTAKSDGLARGELKRRISV